MADSNMRQLTGIRNRERISEFDVDREHVRGLLAPGISAMFRVYNEAENLSLVLPNMLSAFDEVVLVDNGSTDGTSEKATRIAGRLGLASKLSVHHYPFRPARAGDEHYAQDPYSVESLPYYYNWALSKCQRQWVIKWDADMFMPDSSVGLYRQLSASLFRRDVYFMAPAKFAWVLDSGSVLVDNGHYPTEARLYPNVAEFFYTKGQWWEVHVLPDDWTRSSMTWGFYEVKRAHESEFQHWSVDWERLDQDGRKRHERRVLEALTEGRRPSFLTESGSDVRKLSTPFINSQRLAA